MTQAAATRALLGLGAGIVALTLVCLALHVPGSVWVGTVPRKNAVIALILTSGALYASAVALVTRRAFSPRLIWPVLGIAVVLRIALLAAPPFMSTDIYRYVWDGRVQAAGINPYLYVANDPALAFLPHDSIYASMNRVDYAHTIYPPAAQLLYAAVGHISQTVTAMKLALVALECCGIAAMLRLLALAKLPLARVLIYAWNPLAAWAVAGDGHVDGAAIGLIGVAMLAATLRRQTLAGLLLGAAILTKFLPIVIAPALWRRWDWKLPAAAALTIIALYAIYIKAGWLVLGFLPNYTQEEGLAQGSGFWLLAALGHLFAVPRAATPLYLAAGIAALALLALRITFANEPCPPAQKFFAAFSQKSDPFLKERTKELLRVPGLTSNAAIDPVRLSDHVALLAAGTIMVMSPHYPWYFAWLALPQCLSVRPAILWLSVAPVLLYSDPWHDEILIETAVFLPAIILAVIDALAIWPRALSPAAVRSA